MPTPIAPSSTTPTAGRTPPTCAPATNRWWLGVGLSVLTIAGSATEEPSTAPVDVPPVAISATHATWRDLGFRLTLDSVDPDSTEAIIITGPPQHGTLDDTGGGVLFYQPDPGFVGTDTIVFHAEDGTSTSAPATVTISVGTVRINFQPAGVPVPDGWLADTGTFLGPGHPGYAFQYGWNIDSQGLTRDRNDPASPDQRFDTLIHLQKPENPNAVFQLGLPDGLYEVSAVCGDPSYTDSVYRLEAEGTPLVSGTPTPAEHWISSPTGVLVRVRDGFLTVGSGAGAINNKLNFLTVRQLPNELIAAKVNFQPTNVPVPSGWVADSGEVFSKRSDGLTYGWTSDNTGNARLRVGLNIPSPQEENSSFIHMQKPNNPDAVWEMAVPNGTYAVSGYSGDAGYIDSVYRIQLEGVPFISGTPTPAQHFIPNSGFDYLFYVTVHDGRLTLRGFAGAINNKINFLIINEVPQANG